MSTNNPQSRGQALITDLEACKAALDAIMPAEGPDAHLRRALKSTMTIALERGHQVAEMLEAALATIGQASTETSTRSRARLVEHLSDMHHSNRPAAWYWVANCGRCCVKFGFFGTSAQGEEPPTHCPDCQEIIDGQTQWKATPKNDDE